MQFFVNKKHLSPKGNGLSLAAPEGRAAKNIENVLENAPTTFKVLINGHPLNPGGVT